jgi:hypothetical protein
MNHKLKWPGVDETPRIPQIKEGSEQINSKLINVQFQNFIKLKYFNFQQKYVTYTRSKICRKYFLPLPQKTSHQRNWHNKKLSKFAKFHFWDTKY